MSTHVVVYLTTSSVTASDAVVLVLTWIKSFAHWREMRRLKLASSISDVLLRDGTLYFLALLGINVLQLSTYSTNLVLEGTYVSYFVQYLPPLLVQRFILDLRQLNHTTEANRNNSDMQHFSRFSVSFRVPSGSLESIGQASYHGQSEQVEEDGNDDHCVGEGPQDGLEEGLAPHVSLTATLREESAGADVVLVLQHTGRASKEDDVGSSSAPSRAMVIRRSTAAG
ncbi:uncharacterized protein PHACADRAFT_189352 [Phanerochaete carnosa HHB-10118-sp]|uniref:Uncharacterized protein n=1 Tax=Phanerochaete carnosa (strain HHB-10118-sp) TaxID=650164 RepID=K5W8D9_PHACS|nr:uncharacterized protein PHACADRAFT_189352 [Phanerochaete carnosa HHB-10118-sp]EKM60218.1 hypothetical protein PHACADRAFT_189352 [Phanerochaete carnosa HHB-10118-sp]